MATILLAHSNAAVRRSYHELLVGAGLEVVDAEKGGEVLLVWAHHEFDAVVIGELPDCSMGPFEIARWVRKIQVSLRRKYVPVMMITWDRDLAEHQRVFDLAFLSPLNLQHVQQLMRLLEQHKAQAKDETKKKKRRTRA